ncbi:Os09g0401200 [Oryza sativa Japonica Group]|uniref:Os09g0401200 protein n=1 Tax=Oryza sativa subsp. japonica TaxID=39947 RepID=A0A0P0XLG5_ORYSJ|nr:hypothetical protein EE612_047652 [Oryza sativa]BAT07972.1 Os09g0401200 [Oryza sativa Japonica Group]
MAAVVVLFRRVQRRLQVKLVLVVRRLLRLEHRHMWRRRRRRPPLRVVLRRWRHCHGAATLEARHRRSRRCPCRPPVRRAPGDAMVDPDREILVEL